MVEGTAGEIVRSALEAEAMGADLVELRLDSLPELTEGSVERVFRGLEGMGIPKIATIMPGTIFGRYSGSDGARANLLLQAAEFAEYVDLGIEMGDALIRQCLAGLRGKRAEPIVSWHSQRLLSIAEIGKFMESTPSSAVSKVVMPAESYRDNLLALDACSSLDGYRRIIFCHGALGVVSRVLCPLFGSEWAYASRIKGREGAPGQLDVKTMKRLYEVFA